MLLNASDLKINTASENTISGSFVFEPLPPGFGNTVGNALRRVLLTALEYRLLLIFAKHKGQVLSRSQLLEQIWDVAGDFVNDNTLTVYIKRLREKLEDHPQQPKIIKTVRGIGYKVGD